MSTEHDVCIRGAGIVGRTLALLLARERLRVALVAPATRVPEHADVRAYSIGPSGKALLEGIRCWPSQAFATPVVAMQVEGDRHGAVHFSAAEEHVEALNWVVDVPELERLLAEAVRFQGAIEVVEQPVAAPLTVVCEGRASATRAELGIDFERAPYGQTAVATRLECELPHAQVARQWFGPEGEILAFLPLAGPAGREVAVVWSLPVARAMEARGWDDATLAAQLHTTSGGVLGALAIHGARASWPLVVAQATRWVGAMPGRPGEAFALAGDAAHAMHPLAGLGLNVGLGDTAALARIIGERESWRGLADLRLLRRYERARRGPWQQTRLATDAIQRLFTHPAPAAGALRNWGLRAFDRCRPIKSWVAHRAMESV